MVSTSTAAGFRGCEVRIVTVYVYHYISLLIVYCCVSMGISLVEEMYHGLCGGLITFGLGGSKIVESMKQVMINHMGVVYEGTNHFLG